MESEISALMQDGRWELTDFLLGKSVVGCKWVYTVEHNHDGSIERLNALLVVIDIR